MEEENLVRRVIVIGLDGATWDLLKPQVNKGKLNTIKTLMNQGVWANLISTIPPITGPAWTSFSTGKNPGKHGIFDFVALNKGRLFLHKSSDIKSSPIYEILSDYGLYNIIIGLPLSFPPPRLFNGIMISDFLYPTKSIYPQTKKKYIEDYEVYPNLLKKNEDLIDDMITTSLKQTQTAKNLFRNENWQFFFFLFGQTDTVCHHFWKEMLKMNSLGKKAEKIFQIADDFICWIKSEMHEKDLLLIISDHGFGTHKTAIHINNILKNRGLLKTKIEIRSSNESFSGHILKILGEKGKTRQSLISKILIEILNNPLIKRVCSIKKVYWINKIFKMLGLPFYHEIIDFNNSLAFIPSSEVMGIYINKNKEIKNFLINLLKNLKYKEKPVFKKIFTKEELYSGPFTNLGPDILLVPNGFFITSELLEEIYTNYGPSSFHKLEGIFIAYGNNVKKGKYLDSLSIYDIAPTILHAFNLPIPIDMDGKILTIYNKDSEIAKRPIKFTNVIPKIKSIAKDLSKLKKI